MMMADGRAWLFSPSGLLDGPLPTHYEPLESPVHNLLYPEVDGEPGGASAGSGPENPLHPTERPALPDRGDDLPAHRAPHRGRHEPQRCRGWASCSRRCSPRSTRCSPRERGIEDGGWMTIVTERAEIEARAQVTDRMRPLRVDGRLVHQVGAAVALGLRRRRTRATPRTTSARSSGDPERLDPGVQGVHLRRARRAATGAVDRAPEGRRRAARAGGAEPGRPAGRGPAGGRA